jgi:adenylate kinase
MLSEDRKRLTRVIHFQIPDEMLVSRIMGRLVHPSSGRTYHTEFNPPKQAGLDDVRRRF